MSGGPLGSAGGACWLVGLAGLMNLLGLVDLLCHLLLFLAFLSDPKVFSNGSTIFHDQKEFDGLQVISDEIIYLTLMIQMNSIDSDLAKVRHEMNYDLLFNYLYYEYFFIASVPCILVLS